MEKLILNPDFTIDNIHKLKEYKYNTTKDMLPYERQRYYNERGWTFQREIDTVRMPFEKFPKCGEYI